METIIETEGQMKSRSIFKNKNFMLLFFGKLVSQIGDSIYNLAIGWYILEISGLAKYMAVYMAVGTLTFILMGPFGGVLADRWDRKKIIYGMDYIRGIVVAGIGACIFFDLHSILVLGLLYVASVILSICGALFNPASMAVIPLIVDKEQLTKANSLGSMVGNLAGIAGVILGGLLYGLIGIQGIFILNAVSYILSGVSEMFITLPSASDENRALIREEVKKSSTSSLKSSLLTFVHEIQEGYQFVREKKGLYVLIWFCFLLNFIAVPIFSIFIPYIYNQIFRLDPANLSYVNAAMGVGLIVGALILTALPQKEKINGYLRYGLLLEGIPMIAVCIMFYIYRNGGISVSFMHYTMVAGIGLLGIFNAIVNIPIGVAIQKLVPNQLMGRVNSLMSTLVMAAMPLGMLIGGILTDMAPMEYLLTGTVIVIMTMVVFIWYNSHIRTL